jgi:hypothetical protein
MFGGSLQRVSAGRKEASAPSEPRATSRCQRQSKASHSSRLLQCIAISTIIEPCYTSSYIDHIISYIITVARSHVEMLWRGLFFTLWNPCTNAVIAKRLLVQPSVFWLACFLVVFTPPATTLFVDQRQSPSNSDNKSLRDQYDICKMICISHMCTES